MGWWEIEREEEPGLQPHLANKKTAGGLVLLNALPGHDDPSHLYIGDGPAEAESFYRSNSMTEFQRAITAGQ